MFQPGQMRDRITIKRRTETKNSGGGLDISWSPIAENISAQVTSLNGREAVIGHVLQGTSLFKIVIRFRADLKQADQILWNGRELNIITAEDREGLQRWTEIQATTATPQGA